MPIFIENSGESNPRAYIDDILWTFHFVDPDSNYLIDRTDNLRVATTDPLTHSVYLSRELSGDFLRTVLLHELGHVVMFSYGLIPIIHSFVKPNRWVEAEEWVCNFIADYGDEIFNIADSILSYKNFLLPRHTA